jgi:fatty acid/phospholipid biosynthesis enzyme
MRSISSNISIQQAIKSIKDTLTNLGIKIVDTDLDNLVIEARRSGSFLSYGNTIYISLKKKKSGGIRIYVDSESSSPIQLIDWGTNESIENEIINELKDYI